MDMKWLPLKEEGGRVKRVTEEEEEENGSLKENEKGTGR